MINPCLRWHYLLIALIVSGCSSLYKPIDQISSVPTNQISNPGPPEFWQVQSRLSVRHDQEAWSGSLRWQHLPAGDEIAIRDPIGRTRLRASSLAEHNDLPAAGATLEIAGQPIRHGDTIQGLLNSVSELHLPFEQFANWLTATPDAMSQTKINLENGLIEQITDQGWTVVYQKYRQHGNRQLPRKIHISNHETEIRMVISKWQLTL